ncbi:MAG: glycosyltransferase family 4 protein [Anaerolineae bacterium]|nr:glycosyltransferase family 4 protein [Anaerolineae bacterium]
MPDPEPGPDPAPVRDPAPVWPVRILLLGSQMESGGAQRVLLTQAAWLHARGTTVTAAFLYDKEHLHRAWQEQYPFPIINLAAKRPAAARAGVLRRAVWLAGGILRLARLLRRERFDVIETFHHHSNLLGIPLAWLMGVPVRIASHHGHLHGFPAGLNRLHTALVRSRLTTRYVVVSRQLEAECRAMGIPAAKLACIPNGTSLADVPPAEVEALRAELALAPSTPLVLAAGRLAPVKNHAALLRAFPAVLAREPAAVLLIAGEGPLRGELERLARSLGLADRVRFLGLRPDLPVLLRLARVFVLPSLQEGLPLVLLEAMAAGTPVVAAAVGGVPELVRDAGTGLLADPADPATFSAAIAALLADETLQAALAANARALVQAQYGLEQMCRAYEGLWAGKTG